MIEGTMKCYKCGKRSYDDNACLDEETGLPCWRSPAEEDLCSVCAKELYCGGRDAPPLPAAFAGGE
jgi:hypothetical protein